MEQSLSGQKKPTQENGPMIISVTHYLVVCDSCGDDGDGEQHLFEEDARDAGEVWQVENSSPLQHLCDTCIKKV